jgi:tRNA N6-adenosine threonylcarbamoyltransferase
MRPRPPSCPMTAWCSQTWSRAKSPCTRPTAAWCQSWLASRAYLQNIAEVLSRALAEAFGAELGAHPEQALARIDGIAVTNGPGLVGALLVGMQAAKAIALARCRSSA